jgi:hypothetical protein
LGPVSIKLYDKFGLICGGDLDHHVGWLFASPQPDGKSGNTGPPQRVP